MKQKIRYLGIVLISVLIVFIVQTWNKDGWLSLVIGILFFITAMNAVIYNKFAPLVALLIFSSHLLAAPGHFLINAFLVLCLVLIVPLMLLFENKNFENKAQNICVVLAVFFYYFLVIFFKSENFILLYFGLHLEALLFFIFFQVVLKNEKEVVDTIFWHMAFLAIFGVVEFLIIDKNVRLIGPMMSSTAYGVSMSVIWGTWFVYQVFRDEKQYIRTVIFSVLIFIIMLLSGTRMTLIGVSAILMYCVVVKTLFYSNLRKIQKTYVTVFSLIFVVLIIVGGWHILPDSLFIKQGLKGYLSGNMDDSGTGRILSWVAGLSVFSENIVWGIGSGEFGSYMLTFLHDLHIPELRILTFSLKHVHNIYLIILSENGLIGFALMAFIMGLGFINLYKNIMYSENNLFGLSLFGGMIVMIGLGMLDAIPLFIGTMIWGAFYVGLLYRLPIPSKSEIENIKKARKNEVKKVV